MTDSSSYPRLLLMDNGSLRPEAVLALRQLADALTKRLGRGVMPVSLSHVDRIEAQRLDGEPAQTLDRVIAQRLRAGDRRFLILPLFFGRSRALTEVLPQRMEDLKREGRDFDYAVADPVGPLDEEDIDHAMTRLMTEQARLTALQAGLAEPRICLVDHGSPSPQVTAVRHRLAARLAETLGQMPDEAAMERRGGSEYDFNGPLLAEWIEEQAERGATEILLLLMFFLPGRHAGAGGDIESILHTAMQRYPQLRIAASPLVAEHPLLLEILRQRLRDALARFKLADFDS